VTPSLPQAKILIIGLGGLGCPASKLLVQAGIGHLGLIDGDTVDESNLQRQILYTSQDVGSLKVDVAHKRLKELRPDTQITPHAGTLIEENAQAILSPYDLVIDGTDRFEAHYLINDACVKLGKPLIHAAITRFQGQIAVSVPGLTPCYRCIFSEPPPPEVAPPCSETGVLGVLPGLIGTLQATEAIRYFQKGTAALAGPPSRMLRVDLLKSEFKEILISRENDCATCG
jgi:sulfur-carrier protein adenylyltransferase/sulfurtransferase